MTITGLGEMPFNTLLQATAAKSPTPGGGAIAGATGALAASLGGMVVSYSLGRKDLAAHQARLEAAQKQLAAASAEFVTLGDKDAEAYAILNALQKLPPDDKQRVKELPPAVEAAVGVPMRCLRVAVDTARLCADLVPITNKWLASDLKIAAALAEAAARASLCNVLVNAPLLEDETKRATIMHTANTLTREARDLAARVGG